MAIIREIAEGEQEQGIQESIVYQLTTTPWGSSPGTIVATAYLVDESEEPVTYTDKTTELFPTNTPSASGDVISLSPCVGSAMTLDALYRIEIKFTCSSNVFEAYAYIRCRR